MKTLNVLILTFACLVPFAKAEECADGPDMRPLVFVDEKAIENKTDAAHPNFGGLVDRLNNALTESGIYRVLTPKDIGAGLVDDQLFKSLSTDGGKDSSMKTPAYKIALTIMQYGYAKSSGKDMYGKLTSAQHAKIELILRVVDMRSRETLKSKNIARSASGSATVQSNLGEQVLQEACRSAVNDIVATLVQLTPFSVLDVENDEVTIDVPSNRVKQGQQLEVFRLGKRVKNKRTGKVTAKESSVAIIGVQTLSEDSVTCKLLRGAIVPDANAEDDSKFDAYVVRIIEAPPVVTTQSLPAAPTGTAANPF